MAFKWTWSDGTVEPDHSEPAGLGCWFGAKVNVVACEWVEPRKEYRWRVTYESGRTDDWASPPERGLWWDYGRAVDLIVKVERIEVDT